MRKTQAAVAAVLAGGALLGVQALIGARMGEEMAAPEAAAQDVAQDARPTAADAPPAEAAARDATSQDAPDPRLVAAEAERDRLREELAAAAAERDRLAEALAAEEADRAEDATAAELERLTGELAAQAAEIDRLKSELAARDFELAALRDAGKILPLPGEIAAETIADVPFVTLGPQLDPRPARPVAAPAGGPLAEVLFERGSARLTAGAAERAAEAAAALVLLAPARIRLAGHSDTTGNVQSNLRLSLDRAEAVAAALVAAGVPRGQIDIEAHGQAPALLPVPTGPGVAEPLNRSVGIYPVTMTAAQPLVIADESF